MNTILLALCAPSLAATVTVAPDGDFTSLDEAVHESANGDTIQVLASDDELVVIDGRELIIQGMGPDAAVGALQFLGASSVTVSGITVRQGVEVEGGQITLDAMRFEGRGKMTGPALTVRDGTVSAVGITVSDWEMEDGSPVQVFGGDVEVESGSFLRTAGSQGGAMRLEAGLLSVSSSSFEDNRAEGAGGAISATGGHLRVESSSFLSGQAAQGGHISVHGTTATISRSTFEAGEATEGGGLLSFEAAQVTLLGSYMAGGAAGRGGSVYIDGGEADLQDTHSVGSVATDGGHIYASDAQVRVTRSVIESGSATRGGGFFQDGGDVTVQNAVWTGIEWAEVGGAWFQNAGTSRVAFATIGDNRAAAGAGMAVMGGSSAVEGSIISGNHGSEGLYARGAGEMQLSTSLLYGNAGYETIGNITLQAGSMVGDPMIKAPEAGEWMPGSYSPALDSGPPGQLDPDGSPADMGAYGGPFAWRLQDHDQDGYPYGRDCPRVRRGPLLRRRRLGLPRQRRLRPGRRRPPGRPVRRGRLRRHRRQPQPQPGRAQRRRHRQRLRRPARPGPGRRRLVRERGLRRPGRLRAPLGRRRALRQRRRRLRRGRRRRRLAGRRGLRRHGRLRGPRRRRDRRRRHRPGL